MTTHEKLIYGLGLAGLSAVLVFGTVGCKGNQDSAQAAIAQQDATGADPAAANLADGSSTSGQPTQVLGQTASYTPQQQSESYADPGQAGGDYQYNDYDADAADYSNEPPPPLPDYDQPPSPGPDWYWTPGYWAWGTDGYYWVPGTWVEPPYYGALWTPPYWGYYNNRYLFHRGYWGSHVGFYGGVDYGFGYIGIGYYGGYWRGHDFYYNREVTNVGHVSNYYNRPVVVNNVHYGARPQNRVSYNGGRGGLNIRPRPQEMAARSERHTAPIAAQTQMRSYAAQNRAQSFSQNHGKPDHAAFARPEAAGFTPNRAAEPNRPGAQPNRGPEPNHGITPNRGPEPNRGAQQPNRTAEPNRGPQPNRGAEPNHGAPVNNQHTPPARLNNENRPAQPNNRPAQPNNRPAQPNNRPAQPNNSAMHNDHQQPNRAQGAPAPNRAMPQPHNEVRPQPASRPERMPQQARPQQAPHQQARPQEAPRPQPAPRQEMRPQPAPHVEAPHAAPAPHMEAPRPAAAPHGGGGEHPHQR